jgi:hypothetical protein
VHGLKVQNLVVIWEGLDIGVEVAVAGGGPHCGENVWRVFGHDQKIEEY